MAEQLSPEHAAVLRQVVDKAQSAARQGNGEAWYLLAILAASGMGLPHDLTASLEHLQHAAERGHEGARRELAMLRQCGATDIPAWLRSPAAEMLSQQPRIGMIPGFASAALCDWLIACARPHLLQARIFDGNDRDDGSAREDGRRTNSTAELNLSRMDTVVGFLRARIAALAKVPVAWLNAESCQIFQYKVGEQFTPHYDFFDTSHPAFAQEVAANGQRALTVLVYLNEEYVGGHTAFPVLGRSFRGRKGDALLFHNVDENGAPDRRTLHAGTSPTSGEKWLLSQWVRKRTA